MRQAVPFVSELLHPLNSLHPVTPVTPRYLPLHLWQAVPFVSELMEDAESSVRTEALELMRVLEALSEEGFDM